MALLYGTFVRFLAAVVESSEIQAPTVILARARNMNKTFHQWQVWGCSSLADSDL